MDQIEKIKIALHTFKHLLKIRDVDTLANLHIIKKNISGGNKRKTKKRKNRYSIGLY
jgi:hypothetical protein